MYDERSEPFISTQNLKRPNLGAINRSALIATDYVAIPLGADLFSLQGLKNLGE